MSDSMRPMNIADLNDYWDVTVTLQDDSKCEFRIAGVFELNEKLWPALDEAFPNGRADIQSIHME